MTAQGSPPSALSANRRPAGRELPWMIFCADGTGHRDYGVGQIKLAVSEQAARDAAEFMDEDRENSPWQCGPHTVAEA
jgi:hypothetical protein